MKRIIITAVAAALLTIPLAATAARTGVAVAAPASGHREPLCIAPLRLLHATSLRQFGRDAHVSPERELALAAFCFDGTWTPNLRRLLAGGFGPDLMTARLPAGSRVWLPAERNRALRDLRSDGIAAPSR